MTISRPSIYRVDSDPPPPPQITLGVSLVSIEEYTIIQDERAITIPLADEITYITVDRNLVEVPFSSCIKYGVVADLLDKEGFRKSHWKICHIWQCIPEDQHPF